MQAFLNRILTRDDTIRLGIVSIFEQFCICRFTDYEILLISCEVIVKLRHYQLKHNNRQSVNSLSEAKLWGNVATCCYSEQLFRIGRCSYHRHSFNLALHNLYTVGKKKKKESQWERLPCRSFGGRSKLIGHIRLCLQQLSLQRVPCHSHPITASGRSLIFL